MLNFERSLGGGRRCRVRFSDRSDGDANQAEFMRAERERFTLPRQTHSAVVLDVAHPADASGSEADALVSAAAGPVLAIRTADCVPIALYSAAAVGAVHAGWKGLEAGVVESSVERLRSHGAGPVRAIVGPHISARAYEFGIDDLDRLTARWGERARGITSQGRPALDLAAALERVFDDCDVQLDHHV
ncbi:MAG: polyphenol oxidase family protein, partial [Actinomycetota bacterium]|nr:polyphenol oxidase family protein [Actinomycetota bacterium]